MTEQKLTKTERLILTNQFRIRAALTKNKHEAEHFDQFAEVLERGYTLFYGEMFQTISDEMPQQECCYVLDVLEMYWGLQQSYSQLKDKDGIESHDIVFPGFDGNNETEYMAFTRFLRKDGRFEALQATRDFNSHFPTRHKYVAMLEVWERIPSDQRFVMSAAQIRSVLNRPAKDVK